MALIGADILRTRCAAKRGIAIDWKYHARIGIPVTVLTLLVSAVYLLLRF